MSKSGLFAHFGSKEELQLATIETAGAIFAAEVVEPAQDAPAGLPRLRARRDGHAPRARPGDHGERPAAAARGRCLLLVNAEFEISQDRASLDRARRAIGRRLGG